MQAPAVRTLRSIAIAVPLPLQYYCHSQSSSGDMEAGCSAYTTMHVIIYYLLIPYLKATRSGGWRMRQGCLGSRL